MSLINQVLKDLDKRGASAQIGETTIRVVHTHSSGRGVLLVAAGAVGMLCVGVVVWLVWGAPLRDSASKVEMVEKAPVIETQLPVSQSSDSNKANEVIPPLVAQNITPKIESIKPSYVSAIGKVQKIKISGVGFPENIVVTLQDTEGIKYRVEPRYGTIKNQIEISANFGITPGDWKVILGSEDGNVSAPYIFKVKPRATTENNVELVAKVPPLPSLKDKDEVAMQQVPVVAESINKQPTQISLPQQAENEFRRAYQLMRQGRDTEALAGYENTLKLDPGHDHARQTMVSLLLEKKRKAEAEAILQEGLDYNPRQTSFAMLLARLQVEHDALDKASKTLTKTLPYAEKQPEYLAFVAALMQRQNRHLEAIDYYQKALQIKPQSGVWLMGLGISLRAEKRRDEARSAFKNALDSNSLNNDLQAYVRKQITELKPE